MDILSLLQPFLTHLSLLEKNTGVKIHVMWHRRSCVSFALLNTVFTSA